jgi:hypothetical protein
MKIFQYDQTELKFKKVPYTLLLTILASILMFTTLMSYGMSKTIYKTVVITQETQMLVMREQNKFSEEAFDLYLNSLNMKFTEIVKAQAILESSNFSSEIFKANNNMFGMKAAALRPTTNIGTNLGHANFSTWKDCVLDYAFYYASYLREVKTEEQYYAYLGRNYAEDPNYVSKLKNIVEKNKAE